MKNSKRLVSILLALLMVFLVACGQTPSKPEGDKPTETTTESTKESTAEVTETTDQGTETQGEPVQVDLKLVSTTDVTVAGTNSLSSMDYLLTSKAPDHAWNANFVETLVEYNRVGKVVGSLAESWTVSEDGLTWTFKLRPGVKWVTNTAEEFATLTSEDFVTGLRHVAEFNSNTSWLVSGVIKGFAEYMGSDHSDDAWSKVGIKAVDELTLEYSLEKPVPFFADITSYSTLMPVNKSFLESKGAGCALGAPNPEDCSFGNVSPDSILYNGAFLLESYTNKSSIVMVKNPEYYDAANVKLEKYTEVYDDGSDPYSIKKGFESGRYPTMALRPTWPDYAQIRGTYAGYARENLPNATTFGVLFNFNRNVFEETNYATDQALRDNTRKAVLNENFRKALRAAYDVKSYLMVTAPEQLAESSQRNINNFNEAGFHSDGRGYHKIVNDLHNANTGLSVDLSDGKAPFLNKEEALKFIEAAKGEGISFPVHLDMLVVETSDNSVKRANSMKKSISDNTDGQIVIELVLRSEDTVRAIAFDNQDASQADFDISTFAGWGPDYNDPQSYAETFSPLEGTYMTSLGLGTVDADGVNENENLKTQLGFTQYQTWLDEARAIVDDKDARLEAFAKVDSLLIEKALFIPTMMQTRSEVVTFSKPFTMPYSQVGLSEYKLKYTELLPNLLTREEYDAAREAWMKEVEEAAKQ